MLFELGKNLRERRISRRAIRAAAELTLLAGLSVGCAEPDEEKYIPTQEPSRELVVIINGSRDCPDPNALNGKIEYWSDGSWTHVSPSNEVWNTEGAGDAPTSLSPADAVLHFCETSGG